MGRVLLHIKDPHETLTYTCSCMSTGGSWSLFRAACLHCQKQKCKTKLGTSPKSAVSREFFPHCQKERSKTKLCLAAAKSKSVLWTIHPCRQSSVQKACCNGAARVL